jgi:hypothetical protein
MNILGTEFMSGLSSQQCGETGDEAPSEPIPIETFGGGDASDILPENLLEATVAAHVDGTDIAETARTVRGEFASLQRVLETRIARYDAELDVAHEDEELVVYRLERALDFENVLDFCEIERPLLRRCIAELMTAIAGKRAGTAPEHPLVVRKPMAFRAGERHAHVRHSRSADRSA